MGHRPRRGGRHRLEDLQGQRARPRPPQRDIARSARLTVSVQDLFGSAIAFAGIAQLAATVPEKMLRCVLNCGDMVTLKTAEFEFIQRDGGILPREAPGLGLTVKEDALGEPVAVWGG